MADEIKVNDSRLFNADGSIKSDEDVVKETEERLGNTDQAPESESHEPLNEGAHMGPVDFQTFILSLASSVQISMGLIPNPMTGEVIKNLVHAKQTIDILGMLETKTENNLTPEESGLLKQILFQLRMQYVEIDKSGGNEN